MTADELKALMAKVKAQGGPRLSESERTEYLFTRWARLLGMLAESERQDKEVRDIRCMRTCPFCWPHSPPPAGCPHL